MRLIDAESGQETAFVETDKAVWGMQISPDLRFVASLPFIREPDAVFLWDGASGQPRGAIFESHVILSFAFSPDGAFLAMANQAQQIELWDIEAGRFLERSFSPASMALRSLVFSPDGSLLAAADGDDILLWETALGSQPRRLRGHTEAVNCLAFAGDGLTLFSGGRDNRLLQWDLQTGQPRRALEGDGLRTDVVALAFWRPPA